jgi:nicotinamide-nucleotide amidase
LSISLAYIIGMRKYEMKAEIIASGTELLLGETTDTNTPFIASQLAMLGIDLYYSSIVGDNYERFFGVLKQALERADMVIITGGLGPTKGDITRDVIAGVMKEKMEINIDLKEHMVRYFAKMGYEMPENNLKQAMLISSATSIPNPLGTAPGWWVEKAGKIVISMPGPPGEMQPMWQKEVYPRLEKRGGAVILSRRLKTWGVSEARIDQLVGPFMALPNPTLALYARPDGIQLRITAKAADRESAAKIIEQRETELREILKDALWGADSDVMEVVTGQLIISRGLTLAVAESFTGGLLAYTLANVPESNRFFRGGIIAIDNNTRSSLNIVPETPDVRADIKSTTIMADVARNKFDADIGIGIDGYIETLTGSNSGKVFIVISFKQNDQKIVQTYPWRPNALVRRSVMHTIFSLRSSLLKK